MLRWLNLALLVLYPVAWAAPLARAGLLPIFGGSEITILSGIASLWQSDVMLCLLVAAFAMVAPMLKTCGLALHHWGRLPGAFLPVLGVLGRLAMADVFLIALYVVVTRGVGLGYVETAWGLYLFTSLVLASLLISARAEAAR